MHVLWFVVKGFWEDAGPFPTLIVFGNLFKKPRARVYFVYSGGLTLAFMQNKLPNLSKIFELHVFA